jgi:hypothetical protein
MRRFWLAGFAGLALLVAVAEPAAARRGGGWGRVGVGVGFGLGAALAYRGWYGGYPGYYPGYAYPYGPTPAPIYYGPAFDGPAYGDPLLATPAPGQLPPAPPVAAPVAVDSQAPSEARMCRAAIQSLRISCRLTQPTPMGGGCGCPSNMGMLAGQAAP